MRENMKYLPSWHILLNIIMISSCIHFIEDNIILFFFKAKSNTIMYMYHVVSFIHSSAESTYMDSIT